MAPPPPPAETCTIELAELSTAPYSPFHYDRPVSHSSSTSKASRTLAEIGTARRGSQDEESNSNITDIDPPPGAVVAPVLMTWNNPPINRWRLLAAFYGFLVLGEYYSWEREPTTDRDGSRRDCD